MTVKLWIKYYTRGFLIPDDGITSTECYVLCLRLPGYCDRPTATSFLDEIASSGILMTRSLRLITFKVTPVWWLCRYIMLTTNCPVESWHVFPKTIKIVFTCLLHFNLTLSLDCFFNYLLELAVAFKPQLADCMLLRVRFLYYKQHDLLQF
jgi:hypothetical protein